MLAHRYHPHPSPLPSRERGILSVVLACCCPPCGYCLKASMTDPLSVPALWIPAYAGMTVRGAGYDGPGDLRGVAVCFCKGLLMLGVAS